MSLDTNEKCAVCKAYLFEDDDIVHCPECGAPHHRDCYASLGHCGLEEFHGTENQYKKAEQKQEATETESENTVFCGMCGEKYLADAPTCPKCNAPNMAKMGGRVVTIDLMGGVPEDIDLGDGVVAKEAKQFVAVNTHRYMPKFLKFKQGKKASWNWLAFLTPCGWFLSRKMYLVGAVVGALQIALTLLSVPFIAEMNQFDFSAVNGYAQYSNIILENIDMISKTAIISSIIGTFVNLILCVLIGIFADFIYKNRVISKVKEIKTESEDVDTYYRKKGGVNIILGFLGFYLVRELPSIIAYTLGLLR